MNSPVFITLALVLTVSNMGRLAQAQTTTESVDEQVENATSLPKSTLPEYPRLILRDPNLKFMIVMSQGEVFSHPLNTSELFTWSDGQNRSFAVYLATENKKNLSIFESIFFNQKDNKIWALPMSDNGGQNRYHIMARGFGDNVSSIPYEAIVLPNANNPNHKFVLTFQYNYILFEAYLPYRLELLRLISVVMGDGGSFENITLDSYENTTTNGTAMMVIRISNSTIGYEPCNISQMNRILEGYHKLSTGQDDEPLEAVANATANYNLVKVELELLGPCARLAEGLRSKSEETVLSQIWFKLTFSIVIGMIILTITALLVGYLCRKRKMGAAISVRKNASSALAKNTKPINDATFFAVKSKHVPVIFADEYDEQSSINQISAASPLILKNEKPPAKDLGLKMNGSLNHSPINGPNYHIGYDHYAPNGASSLSSCMINNTCPGSAILYANSQNSTMSHRYCPSQYRPPPPYKPPSKAIIPS